MHTQPDKPAPAERRQITALHCELTGSLRQMASQRLHDFQTRLGQVVRQYGGTLVRAKGAVSLVYFGYPQAREDDADRAVLAALELHAAAQALLRSDTAPGVPQPVRFRAGIHSGVVVLGGEVGNLGPEQLAIGDAPGIAARFALMDVAADVVVSHVTRDLAHRQAFQWVSLGEHELRGVDRALRLWAPHRAATSDGDVVPRRALPVMVGREAELQGLWSAYHAVDQGGMDGGAGAGGPATAGSGARRGSLSCICAEPGMGKTLLLSHFSGQVAASGARVHVLQCSSYNNSTEWFPVLTWFEAQMGTGVSDPAPLRWAALQRVLLPDTGADDAILLAQRMSIAPSESGVSLPNVTPAVARARTEALACRCLAMTGSVGVGTAPAVVIIEDLHWADPSTLAFIDALLAYPVSVVVTYRPEFSLPARADGVQPHAIRLTEIKGAQASAIARGVASGKQLPAAIVERIVEVTDGNPFFIAEYTRAVLNSGRLIERDDSFELVGDLPAGLIPSTLRDSLTARLDQLGAARYVARYAAVLGRRFDVAVLQAVVPDGAAHVVARVQELVASGLIRPCDGATDTSGDYEFQHALIQVAAYESMLRRERENMHARVASRLDAVFPAWAERHPALVARHLTESRQWVPAAQRWLAAALRSLASCAYGESIAQANEGLALIRHMEGEGAAAMELALRSTLGPALIASTGFASDIVGQTYARAEALCSVVGDRPEAFPSLWGNWVYNLVSARLDVSLGYAQRMHAMGTACGASAMLVEACWTRGNTHLWLGELAAADHWLAQAEAHYDFDAHGANAVHFGQDPGVAAACYRSMTLLQQGRLGDARQAWLQAQALGVRRDHPFSTAWVLAFDHMMGMNCNPTHALQASQRTLDFCYTQGAPFWIAAGHAVHGWAACKLGNRDEGLRELRMGMAMYEAIGSSLVQPEWHALLAECHLMAGEIDAAQGVIETGLVKAHRNRERLSDITLHTLRGECAVQSHDWAGAQAALETAIRIADECGAGWRRLLASTHLHRVYARTGQHERSALAHHLRQVSGGDHLVGVQAAMGLLNE